MEEKDKIGARLEEMTKSLRQKAIEMEEAITIARNLKNKDIEAQKKLIEETEEKLRYYKYILARILAEQWAEKRQRIGRAHRAHEAEAPEDRVFAQASTGDEAEGDVPSPEERAFALNGKTKQEVLESGSLVEKIRLYLCYRDDNGYAGSTSHLTAEEMEKITLSIKTIEEQSSVDKWLNEYNSLCRFGEQLRFYFKGFQTSFAALAKLLNLWESYDNLAKFQTEQVRALIDMPTEEETNGETDFFTSEEQKDKTISNIIEVVEGIKLSEGKLRWDGSRSFIADIYEAGGLYEKILQEAMETEAAMSDFKALAVAAEQFIEKSELHYTPISIQMPIENAKTERYTRYLVKNLSYFRSDFSQKRSFTTEMKKRALIPDYYETKPNKELYRDARAILK